MLMGEWSNPSENGQPLIIIEGQDGEPRHIYVIWDEWGELSQVDRSEVIMDVVDHLAGEAVINDPVTVAMGLTSEEARRFGIDEAA